MRDLLHETADHAADFLDSLGERPVFPQVDLEQLRARLGGPLPEASSDPSEVIAELSEVGSAAAVAIPGGRYFGFVIGGAVPASLAADWLTSAWDQNAGSMWAVLPRPWSRRSPAPGSPSCSAFRPTPRSRSSPVRSSHT